jgi:hypothetical protein
LAALLLLFSRDEGMRRWLPNRVYEQVLKEKVGGATRLLLADTEFISSSESSP